MKAVRDIEKLFIKWHKQSPINLPEGGRKWISENAWWLVIVGVIVSAIAAIQMVRTALWADSVVRQIQDFSAAFGVTTPGIGGEHMVGLWISILTLAAVVALQVKAIQPLKEMKRAGWDLLFLGMLVSTVGATLSSLVQGEIVSAVIGLAIGLVIGGFILFEIRDKFVSSDKKAAKSSKTDA